MSATQWLLIVFGILIETALPDRRSKAVSAKQEAVNRQREAQTAAKRGAES